MEKNRWSGVLMNDIVYGFEMDFLEDEWKFIHPSPHYNNLNNKKKVIISKQKSFQKLKTKETLLKFWTIY